jgi:3-isopropylmalate dehydrogenase
VNIHPGQISIFEPVHGSAPSLMGKDPANPMPAIRTVGMVLDYLGFPEVATEVEDGVAKAVHEDRATPGLGGTLGTRAVGDWICAQL